MKRMLAMAASAATLAAYAGDTSAATYVSLDTESTAIWRTAFSNPVTFRWSVPPTAKKAVLTVTGVSWMASIDDLAGGSYVLELPPATSARNENVYTLVLAFDDGSAVTGQVAAVTSAAASGAATARVKAYGSASWGRFPRRAVVLVPHGATGLSVDGEAAATLPGGAEGWHALGDYRAGSSVETVLSASGGEIAAHIFSMSLGTVFTLH